MKAWSPGPALLGEQSLMASLPCVGGGAGHGVNLPVLQQLQPLQLLLVVLAHLQDGGPRGWGRGEGGTVNTLGSSVWEGAALDGPCSVASPPRHQALDPGTVIEVQLYRLFPTGCCLRHCPTLNCTLLFKAQSLTVNRVFLTNKRGLFTENIIG